MSMTTTSTTTTKMATPAITMTITMVQHSGFYVDGAHYDTDKIGIDEVIQPMCDGLTDRPTIRRTNPLRCENASIYWIMSLIVVMGCGG